MATDPSQSKSSHHQIRVGGPGRVHHPSKLFMIYRKLELVVFEFGSEAASPAGPLSIEICWSSNFTCSITFLQVFRPGPRLHHPSRFGRHRIRVGDSEPLIHRNPVVVELGFYLTHLSTFMFSPWAAAYIIHRKPVVNDIIHRKPVVNEFGSAWPSLSSIEI